MTASAASDVINTDSYQYDSAEAYGAMKFSCQDCNFYIFHNEATMLEHCRRNRHGVIKDGNLKVPDFVARQAKATPLNVSITLGYLCWNTKTPSVEGVAALIQEADRLEQLHCPTRIVIVDNGSTDGTPAALQAAIKESRVPVDLILNTRNFGSSIGRNQIIESALTNKSESVLLMDGDIEVVPVSVYTMARYLECHRTVGCIGAYSSNCTNTRVRAARALYELPENKVKRDIGCAWTQYGLFRCLMFKLGIRFDESGPFGEPGWGYEDDDLYWQMHQHKWDNLYFGGMTYLHRNLRSSWPNLEKAGVNVKANFEVRKQYLLNKWARFGVEPAKLLSIKAQQCPTSSIHH